jgi:hypothetical protein
VTAQEVLAQVEQAMTDRLGSAPVRASVSFVGVEPIELLRFSGAQSMSILTRGMARAPMGEHGPRAELIVEVRGDGGQLWRQLAILAAAPVVEGVVYSPGLSVDLGTPLDASSRCTGGVITESDFAAVDTAAGPVAILRFVPATSTELAYGRVQGSAALHERWRHDGTDLLDLKRAGVDLS